MKLSRIISVFLMLIPLFLTAQQASPCPSERRLAGRVAIETKETYTIYLQAVDGAVVDSARMEDGRFSFCLDPDALPYYILRVKEAPDFSQYLLTDFSGQTTLEIEEWGGRGVQVRGPALFGRWKEARTQTQQLFGHYLQDWHKGRKEGREAEVQKRYDQLFREKILALFSEDPILSVAVLRAEISRLEAVKPSWETATVLRDHLQALPPAWREAPAVRFLTKTLGHYIYARQGAEVEDFTISGLYGNLLASRDYRGQYLLLDFWGSWCQPCLEKNELLRARYEELRAANLVVLTIMMDYARQPFSEAQLQAAMANDPGYPWPQGVLFQNEHSNELIDFYRAYLVPRTVLVDPNGKIIATDLKTPEEILDAIHAQR